MALTQVSTDGIKNGTITGSDLATNVDLVDDQKLRLGTGNDLQIYHAAGAASHINATGLLNIDGTTGVRLEYNNATRLETTSDGVSIPTDSTFLRIGAGQDLDLHHNGTNSFIRNKTGNLHIRPLVAEEGIILKPNGAVELYNDNSKKLNTNANGVHITDTLTFANTGDSVLLADNQKVSCGNGGDLKIYHDGSNSYIQDTDQGNLFIEASAVLIRKNGTTENIAKFIQDGAVELYYDNSKKFETTSGGVEITDNLNMSGGHIFLADNFKLNVGTGDDLQIYHDGNHSYIQDAGTGNLIMKSNVFRLRGTNDEEIIIGNENGNVQLYYDNSKKFETTSVGASIPDSGNQTASSAHTTGALFCNLIRPVTANNNSYTGTYFMNRNAVGEGIKAVGIVETGLRVGNFTSDLSATEKIKLTYDGHIEIQDNGKLKIGTSDDLQLYHTGSHSYIKDAGTGNLIVSTSQMQIINAAEDEMMARFDQDGAVELYHNGTKKLETTSVGVTMNDTVITNGEIRPASDNDHSIGRSNRRYITYFGVNSPVNTSDKNEKNTIIDSDLGLDFINKLKPISYKWNKDDGKTHYGLIAQDLEETLTSLGKTIADFGGIYKEDDSPMGLGYSELIAPLIKAVQELSTEVAALKAS